MSGTAAAYYTPERHKLLQAVFDSRVSFRVIPLGPGGDDHAWFVGSERATPAQSRALSIELRHLLRACGRPGARQFYELSRPAGIDTLILWHRPHSEGV